MTTNPQILEMLHRFVNQRPGLDFGNYGDVRSYRSEMHAIARDRADAIELLAYVGRSSITAEQILDAMPRAYSGRLSWDGRALTYTTGQYFPTEYRKAVCAVLASAIWSYWREDHDTADKIRAAARRTFGRGIASRWFR